MLKGINPNLELRSGLRGYMGKLSYNVVRTGAKSVSNGGKPRKLSGSSKNGFPELD